MMHKEIVTLLTRYASQSTDVQGLFALGSYARKEIEPYSDLDLVIFSKKKPNVVFSQVEDVFANQVRFILIEGENKQIFFLGDEHVKLDLIVTGDLELVKILFLGFRIESLENSIIIDKTGQIYENLKKWKDEAPPDDIVSLINDEVEKFLISFEATSSAARKEDVFQSYFQYNLSLTRYIRMLQLEQNDASFLYAPKRIMNKLRRYQVNRIERLNGTLKLNELRYKIEHLAIEFREIHSKVFSKIPGIRRIPEEIHSYLQEILDRDLIWNFRDIGWTCPELLREGQLFRSSALSRFDGSRALNKLLERRNIQRIIDLRLPWEIDRYPYKETPIEIVSIPMKIRPEESRRLFYGEWPNHVLLIDNDVEIQRVFKALSDGIPTVIHCHVGRDRTGVVIALIELAVGIPVELVKKDFLSSQMGVKEQEFQDIIDAINTNGGIKNILITLGVASDNIIKVKEWLRCDR